MGKRGILELIGVIILVIFSVGNVAALAFPTAEGYGAQASGGRGGRVIIVDTLEDVVANDGKTSLREALTATGPRIIVFNVSGTITLNSFMYVGSSNSDFTLAGQTAPGDGIAIKGEQIYLQDCNNVIIRYMRFRTGLVAGSWDRDAFTIYGCDNLIFDHCSFSWATDENFDAHHGPNGRLTVQWSIFSEGLSNAGHDDPFWGTESHSAGAILGYQYGSYHHNLFSSNAARNPLFLPYPTDYIENTDFRNNVIYNWALEAASRAQNNGNAQVNWINNYYKLGPAINEYGSDWILNADGNSYAGSWYVEGNVVTNHEEFTADNWGNFGTWEGIDPKPNRAMEEFSMPYIDTSSADVAYDQVLDDVGATFPKRDSVDTRVIEGLKNGTSTVGGEEWGPNSGIIDNPSVVGGWPVLTSAPAPLDSDNDGMPDYWEDEQGLDKNVDDSSGDINNDGYTNIENYINGLVDDPVVTDCGNGVREGIEECDLGDSNGECPSTCNDQCRENNCDGECGSAIGDYYVGDNFPSGNLCDNGDASPSNPELANTEGASVSWTCLGLSGGQDDSCSAQRIAIPECVDSSASTWQEFLFDNQIGLFTFVFNATPSADGIDSVLGLSAYKANEYNDLAVIVRFSQEGIIDVRNASDYTADESFEYSAGIKYNIRMDIDIPNKKYDVYVDDVLLAQDYLFRTQQASVNNLSYWNIRVGYADHGHVEYCGTGIVGEEPCDPYDLNCNGDVNLEDVLVLITKWGQSGEYDLNLDGTVNLLDIMIIVRNYS